MYNVADDLSSPFMTTGRTVTHEEVVNGPNVSAAMNNKPLPPRPIPVILSPTMTSPRLAPRDHAPDLGTPDRPGISPPKLSDPAPGELSPIGTPLPTDPTDTPTGGGDTPQKPETPKTPIDRLIDLIGAQIAGGGTLGGTVALPTTTTSDSNGAANAFILIAIVGVLGFLGWKMFHKKAA